MAHYWHPEEWEEDSVKMEYVKWHLWGRDYKEASSLLVEIAKNVKEDTHSVETNGNQQTR